MKIDKYLFSFIILFYFFNTSSNCASLPKDTVTLQLKWFNQYQFAGYYAAIQQGFYSTEGIFVKLIDGYSGIDITEVVLSGNADIGIQTSKIIVDRAAGYPVVVIAAIFQHSPLVLITKDTNLFESPQGLVNKKIMWREKTDSEIPAMLINESVQNYIHIEHTFSMDEFIRGEVDATSAYITDQPFDLLQKGIDFNLIKPINYGIDFYGDCLFTSEKYLKNNKKLVERFLNATYKGWNFAMHNPDEIIEYIIDKYPEAPDSNALKYEFDAMQNLILTDFIPIGYMNPGRWKHIQNVYSQLGIINEPVNLNKFIYSPQEQSRRRLRIIIYITLITGAFLLLLSIFLFYLRSKLNSLIAIKTKELNKSNLELEDKFKEIELLNIKLEDALQRAKESDQLKMAFIQNISHEIRTPLNAIIGFSNIISGEKHLKDKERIAGIIETNGEVLISAIENLVQVSNLEVTDNVFQAEKINLRSLCEDIVGYSKGKNKSVEVIFDEDSIPEEVYTDKLILVQVINNLLSNAFKNTKEGFVKFGYKPYKDNKILFYVSDTGIGIREKDYKVIFNRFTKLDAFKLGTGLGLYICKSLVKKLGGEIWLESELNHGSTFYFTFEHIFYKNIS